MGGSNALQISEIKAFCDLVEIANSEERVKYLSLMQRLDRIWLQAAADEAKKKQPRK